MKLSLHKAQANRNPISSILSNQGITPISPITGEHSLFEASYAHYVYVTPCGIPTCVIRDILGLPSSITQIIIDGLGDIFRPETIYPLVKTWSRMS
jgi:hypothetical protein